MLQLLKLAFIAFLILQHVHVSGQRNIDHKLVRQLRKMEKADQKWRNAIDKVPVVNGKQDSIALQKCYRNMNIADSLHYPILQSVFKKYGYPGYDITGSMGDLNFWLLVQHQDKHPSFQDSVLHAMKIQVDSGKANIMLYAYLLDRVNLNTGKLQVYGTQVIFNTDSNKYLMRPCEDPAHVNERRKSVGLGTIEGYLDSFNRSLAKKPE